MNISNIFYSHIGMYISQSFFHSLVAAVIIRRFIRIWEIKDPLIKQRYLLPVIVIPVFSYPFYLLMNPERNLTQFRLSALFDSNRWLMMDMFGRLPVSGLFILVLLTCIIIFLFQELIPILRHLSESKNDEIDGTSSDYDHVISESLEELNIEKPEIIVLDENDFVLYSTTGKDPAVFISSGLLKVLEKDQIRAALVHEMAHIQRSRMPLLIILYVMRAIMLFNPIVLLVFRRVVQEEEKICDDVAVSITKNAGALADTLKKQYHKNDDEESDSSDASGLKQTLEEYGYNLQIEGRIQRLEQGDVYNEHEAGWIRYTLTIIMILVINYFVV